MPRSHPGTFRRVWFLFPPRTGLLNIAGPWEVLAHTNDLLGQPAYQLELFGTGGPQVPTGHGVIISGVRALPRAGTRLPDVVIVAGAPRTSRPEEQQPLVNWLRRHHPGIPTIVSICTGAFLLGAAGLLEGRRATTHWMYLDQLRAQFPGAQVVDEGIFTSDRGVWTSAGITSGIDLALALVEEQQGHRVAMAVAKRLVLFRRRSGNQQQFSSPAQAQGQGSPKLQEISAFVLAHIEEALPVERVAAGVGMSPRTLSRWCGEHLHESPAMLVRRLRIDEARRLLEETELPLKDITARTGLGDSSTMWRVFTGRLGVTPAAYRQRFASERPQDAPSPAGPRKADRLTRIVRGDGRVARRC